MKNQKVNGKGMCPSCVVFQQMYSNPRIEDKKNVKGYCLLFKIIFVPVQIKKDNALCKIDNIYLNKNLFFPKVIFLGVLNFLWHLVFDLRFNTKIILNLNIIKKNSYGILKVMFLICIFVNIWLNIF